MEAIFRTPWMLMLLAAFCVATAQIITVTTEGYTLVGRQWRAPHGESGLGVPAPFGGRLMAGGGTGASSSSTTGIAGGRVGSPASPS